MNIKVIEQLRLENQLCFALYAASRKVIRLYKPHLDEIGLTYTQYITMLVLWERGAVTSKELGKILYLDSGTLTPLLKKLEKQGNLTRDRLLEDERNLIIKLTEKGWKLRDKAEKIPERISCSSGIANSDLIELREKIKEVMK